MNTKKRNMLLTVLFALSSVVPGYSFAQGTAAPNQLQQIPTPGTQLYTDGADFCNATGKLCKSFGGWCLSGITSTANQFWGNFSPENQARIQYGTGLVALGFGAYALYKLYKYLKK